MMSKYEKIRYSVKIMASCLFLCGTVAGCGIRDSAMVIPIEETEGTESNDTSSGTGEAAEGMQTKSAIENESESAIYVYVCGAVAEPGVVMLPEGSRADDALQAAGGFVEDAQKDYVNLAAKLEDGEKLYFPTVAEAEELDSVREAEQNGLVNINTADTNQLMTLPGIGEARARDIITYREEHGDFEKKEDLKKVSGIKENMYEKLCERIVVQ